MKNFKIVPEVIGSQATIHFTSGNVLYRFTINVLKLESLTEKNHDNRS